MKIGTIGTGSIVEKFLNAAERNEGVKGTAVYSRTQEKADHLANMYGITKRFTKLEQLLEEEEADFIYVGSPNSLHYEYTKAALEHGKNVICEKPFTSNAAQLKELTELAKEKHLFLFEAITTIHLPNLNFIKENLERIGTIKLIRTNFTQFSTRYQELMDGKMTNVFDLSYSGGSLMDLNCYNIHFVMGLFGVPKKVTYIANKHQTGIDTSGIAILSYPGFLAECCASKDSDCQNSCEIQGSNGYIKVNSQSSRCTGVTVQIQGKTAEEWNAQEIDNVLYYELKDFINIYKERDYKTCYRMLDYSMEVMKVLDAARKDAGIIFPSDFCKEE